MNIVPVHGSAALHFVDESILLLSDLHYGVEAEMLRGGVWVPNRSTSRTEKVLKLLKETKSKKLILLGDIKHQVPHNSKQQKTDLEQFFMAVTRISEVEIVPGNHDGGLQDIAPDNVIFHNSKGCVVGNVGLIHGHAWPSQEVMNSELLIMGHEHPALSFRDRLDKLHSEPCWLRAPMIEHERYGNSDFNIIIDCVYKGESLQEFLDAELVDRGYDDLITVIEVKNGEMKKLYSSYNGEGKYF